MSSSSISISAASFAFNYQSFSINSGGSSSLLDTLKPAADDAVVRRNASAQTSLAAELAKPQTVQQLNTDDGATSYTEGGSLALLIAAMIESNGGDSKEFLKHVRELEEMGSGGSSSSSTQLQASQSSASALMQSGNSTVAAAVYSAEVSAQFTQQVVAEDGTRYTLDISLNARVEVGVAVAQSSSNQQCDPLALDIDHNGSVDLAGADNGVLFDIDGDGVMDQTAFVTGPDVFLAMDRNGNGQIDDGQELFGDQHGAANGFEELAKFDEDQNGWIDAQDSIFGSLQGVSLNKDQGLTAYTLESLGVAAIKVGYTAVSEDAGSGCTVSQRGQYQDTSGALNTAVDLLLEKKAAITA